MLVLVPITVAAGRVAGRRRSVRFPAVQRHQALGEMLLPWAIGLFVVAAAQWAWYRSYDERMRRGSPRAARAVVIVLAAASVVVGAGTLVLTVLIGDSGARAVWGELLG